MQHSHNKRYRLKDIVKSSEVIFEDYDMSLFLTRNKKKRSPQTPEDLPFREKSTYRISGTFDCKDVSFQNKVTGILKKCVGMLYEDAWQLVKQKFPKNPLLMKFIHKEYKLPETHFYVDNEGILQRQNEEIPFKTFIKVLQESLDNASIKDRPYYQRRLDILAEIADENGVIDKEHYLVVIKSKEFDDVEFDVYLRKQGDKGIRDLNRTFSENLNEYVHKILSKHRDWNDYGTTICPIYLDKYFRTCILSTVC